MIAINCPNPQCGVLLGFREDQAGSMGACSVCKIPVYIPHPAPGRGFRITRLDIIRKPGPRRRVAIAAAVLLLLGVLGGTAYYFLRSPHPGPAGNSEPEFGGDFASARLLSLSPAGAGSQAATLREAGRAHVFKVVAPIRGTLLVQHDPPVGSRLDALLQAYDEAHQEVAHDAAEEDRRVGRIQFSVEKDKVYFVKIAGAGKTTGDYRLNFNTVTAPGSTFDTALPIRLSRAGFATQAWRLENAGEGHFFRFESPLTGVLTVRQEAASGSSLNSHLYAYDADRKVLTDNDDTIDRDSEVHFAVTAGKTYYVKAGSHAKPGEKESTGAYVLSFGSGPGAERSLETARPLVVPSTGKATQWGNIHRTGDAHYYRFTAPLTGRLTARLDAVLSSPLDPDLTVYDGDKKQVATNDDRVPGTLNSQVDFAVSAGQVYYFKAACSSTALVGHQTGLYLLTLHPAAAPSTAFESARRVQVPSGGEATQRGSLGGQVEAYYYFVAPATGRVAVRLDAGPGSMLDPELFVYDARQEEIGHSDDINRTRGNFNCRVEINVRAGLAYYVKVCIDRHAGEGQKSGAYLLTLGPSADTKTTAPGPRPLRVLEGHAKEIVSIAVSSDGKRLLSASDDGTVRLWDLEAGKELRRMEGNRGEAWAVAFSPDDTQALAGGQESNLALYEVATGKQLRLFPPHPNSVRAVAFLPDGRRALSGCCDNLLRLWDVEEGKELRRFTGHTDYIFSVACSPDGKRALTGGGESDRTVRLWDLESGKELHKLTGHTERIMGVAFSPDGKKAVSGCWDGTVRLWDLERGVELRSLSGAAGHVHGVAFSPDGRRIAAGDEKGKVLIWDVGGGPPRHVFEGHDGNISEVKFSPRGDRLYSAGGRIVNAWVVP
jgi:hypothetical protein